MDIKKEITLEDTFAALLGLCLIDYTASPFIGEFIPIDEFLTRVNNHDFVNGNGTGYWATKKYVAKYLTWNQLSDKEHAAIYAVPLWLYQKKYSPPIWATHVLWYSK